MSRTSVTSSNSMEKESLAIPRTKYPHIPRNNANARWQRSKYVARAKYQRNDAKEIDLLKKNGKVPAGKITVEHTKEMKLLDSSN
jgi:hypothetical protein